MISVDQNKRRNTARSYIKLAKAMIKETRIEAASDLLAIARDLNPNDREAIALTADVYYRLNQSEKARVLWTKLAADASTEELIKFRIFKRLAHDAFLRGANHDAAEYLASHLRIDPLDDRSSNRLLVLRLAEAPVSLVSQVADKHFEAFGRPSLSDLALAIYVERYNNPDLAATKICAATDLFVGQRDLAHLAADALEEMGYGTELVGFLEKSEQLFPEDERFLQRRVRALVASGANSRLVEQAADSLVQRSGGTVRASIRKMQMLASVRNWAAVVGEAEALMEKGIFDVSASIMAIRGYIWLERTEKADDLLFRCTQELSSGNIEDQIKLSRLEIAANRPDLAVNRLAAVYKAQSSRARARAEYAKALALIGDYASSWTIFSDNLNHATDNLVVRKIAARCAAALDLVPDPLARFPDALFEEALKIRRVSAETLGDDVVVICTSTLAAGGAERQVALTASHVANRRGPSGARTVLLARDLSPARGNAVMLGLAQSAYLEIKDMANSDHVEVFRMLCTRKEVDRRVLKLIGAFPDDLFRDIVKLYANFLELRPRVVHLWQDGRISVGAVAAVLAGVPRIIASVRNVAPLETDRRRFRPFLAALYPALGRHPDIVITANSVAGAADYERVYNLKPGSIIVLRNGIDREEICARAPSSTVEEVRTTLNLPEGARLVGGVFRLAPAKRPGLWLDVALRVLAQEPNVYFVIIGDGVLRDQLEAISCSTALSNRLIFAGSRTPVEPWIAAMDLMLLVSEVEGVPNVVLEAASLGVPVVATDAGGTAEAILDGKTGTLVTNDHPDELASAVCAYLLDNAKLESARQLGPRFIAERFGMKRMVDDTIHIYNHDEPRSVLATTSTDVRLLRRWLAWMRNGFHLKLRPRA